MNKIIIIFLFTILSLHSQNIDFIKNQDTIYVKYIGNIKNETKKETLNKDNIKFKFYRLIKHSILFSFPLIKQKDSMPSKILNDYRLVDKAFLKKIKNKTIGYLFFNKFSSCNDCEIFISGLKNKVVYIIDYTELIDGKTPLYEVRGMKYCPHIQ